MVNKSCLYNASLKLRHNGVGRRLAHRQDERCVCGTGGQGQQSLLAMSRFLAKGYCNFVQDAAITMMLQQDGAPPPESLCNLCN